MKGFVEASAIDSGGLKAGRCEGRSAVAPRIEARLPIPPSKHLNVRQMGNDDTNKIVQGDHL